MKIVLAVGGSIAAYKACDLTSKCVQAGHDVDVMCTASALQFVQPMAFTALTHRAVFTEQTLWDTQSSGAGSAAHLRATENADLLIVAPCTANLIGKFANGIADEIVSTTYIGASCPVLVAPAMNHRMWAHPRVQANVDTLRGDGVTVVGPESGFLAERDAGLGRMTEPVGILAEATRLLSEDGAASSP